MHWQHWRRCHEQLGPSAVVTVLFVDESSSYGHLRITKAKICSSLKNATQWIRLENKPEETCRWDCSLRCFHQKPRGTAATCDYVLEECAVTIFHLLQAKRVLQAIWLWCNADWWMDVSQLGKCSVEALTLFCKCQHHHQNNKPIACHL